MVVAVKIDRLDIKLVKTGPNKGRKMAGIFMSDGTGAVEAVIFTENYAKFSNLLTEGATVMVKVERNKKDKDQIVIQDVKMLN